jgi:hypothetical protein
MCRMKISPLNSACRLLLLVSCSAYTSTLKIQAIRSSETSALQSQKTVLYIITGMKTSDPTEMVIVTIRRRR